MRDEPENSEYDSESEEENRELKRTRQDDKSTKKPAPSEHMQDGRHVWLPIPAWFRGHMCWTPLETKEKVLEYLRNQEAFSKYKFKVSEVIMLSAAGLILKFKTQAMAARLNGVVVTFHEKNGERERHDLKMMKYRGSGCLIYNVDIGPGNNWQVLQEIRERFKGERFKVYREGYLKCVGLTIQIHFRTPPRKFSRYLLFGNYKAFLTPSFMQLPTPVPGHENERSPSSTKRRLRLKPDPGLR